RITARAPPAGSSARRRSRRLARLGRIVRNRACVNATPRSCRKPSADSALGAARRRCASSGHRVSSCGGINMKRIAGLILCGLRAGGGPACADADAAVDWNQITVDAVTAGRPGPIGLVDIALVHVAVHDAVQAIEKRFEPYHFEVERA